MAERGKSGSSRSRFPDGFRILQGSREYVTYLERSSVRVWYSQTPQRYDTHFHSAVEIIVPLKGLVTYILPEGEFAVREGDILLIPQDCPLDLAMVVVSAGDMIIFERGVLLAMRDLTAMEPALTRPLFLKKEDPGAGEVRRLLLAAVECYEKREPMWNSMCYAYFLQMYVTVGRNLEENGLSRERDVPRMDTEIIDSALTYIDQDYMHDIDLGAVAAFSGFSKYYFSRMFKEQVGMSFSGYLRKKRVEVAEDRLIHSHDSVQTIAMASGFGSIATFNRVFKDAKNLTPSRYREIYADFL